MITKVFTSKQLKKAAQLIKCGELVAFPTETVYGLGANALDPKAVKKIFKAKGRPSDNPLIVHISKEEQLHEIAVVTNKTKKLIQKFWPGPLTIVLKKKKIIPPEVTGGLDTVAIRMPKNKIALAIINLASVPIAAPSANISGKPSGTSFKHVFEDFNGKIAGIIRSVNSEIGVESTVVDLTSKVPVLLRPGGVSFEKLKQSLPNLTLISNKTTVVVKSPGMKYKHYSPNAKIILFEKSATAKIESYRTKYEKYNKKVKIINPKNKQNFSKKLFNLFRQCDKEKIDLILISSVEEKGIGLAIMNRIRKAASKIVI
ncbi:threonylcarbamoyl-AMP synthase [Candidatus Woesearchaeota archaeon]|nr:threonylcarbamoyl-AMP synthase [Candidatus Woesearchaeota archaeon]